MRAVDTNVLVRLLARDDADQASRADTYVAGGAWVSLIALVEAIWVLDAVYSRTPAQLAAGLALLLDHRDLVIQDADVASHALVTFRKHPSIGFSNCLILQQARRSGHLPLGTFDRALAKVEGAERIPQ
jgi:predicted nucleic-acid-binding protein